MYRFEAWRRHLRAWTIPLVFCVLNLIGVVIYRSTFAGNVELLQNRVKTAQADLANLKAERSAGEAFVENDGKRQEAMRRLHAEHFATRAERYTTVITEARRLATEAGLAPRSFSLPTTKLEDWELNQLRIAFPVDGTYDELRTFMNFLELTDQFLTLERISLADGGGQPNNPTLSIQIELSTMFVASEHDRKKKRRGSS